MRYKDFAPRLGAVLAAILVGGCSGDGGGTGGGSATAQVSGAIVKGPVAGALVCAYEVSSGGKGRQLACTTSSADGSYDLSLEHRGPVIVEATGGAYTDEATGTPSVALATPLGTFGEVTDGTTTLVATPLTTLALNAAGRSGGVSRTAFDAAAQQVKTAFSLAADVDLARSRPDITPGSVNAYGRALVGFSRMLKAGASLPVVVTSADLVGLKAAYESCSSNAPDPAIEVLSGISSIAAPGGANAIIDVFRPFPAWRATLQTTGQVGLTGCEILANTAERVRLSCDPATPRASITIRAGDAVPGGTYGSTPSSSALTLAGNRIVVSGGMLLTDNNVSVTIDAGSGSVQMGLYCVLTEAGGVAAPIIGGGVIITNNPPPLQINTGGSITLTGSGSGPLGNIGVPAPPILPPALAPGTFGTVTLGGGGLSVSGSGEAQINQPINVIQN